MSTSRVSSKLRIVLAPNMPSNYKDGQRVHLLGYLHFHQGRVGRSVEKIVAQWLTSNECKVSRPSHSGCDRVVNGINMEIKFSTRWKNGGYTFQQLRDQDYSFVFCLGISPNDVHAWLIPKAIAWDHATPQHGGKIGKDTKWLSFPADSPPAWLAAYGGSLADVLKIVRTLGKS